MLNFESVEPKSVSIKVYVSNLGAYNAGTLTGKWSVLPVDDVKTIFEDDRQKYGKVQGYGQEFFISDYEAPFKIGKYANISQLNNLARALKKQNLKTIEDVYYSLDDRESLYIDEPVEFDEDDFNELTYGLSHAEVARAVFFGNIKNWKDDLIRFDGNGNLESLTYDEWYKELNVNAHEFIKAFAEENGI